MTINHMNNEDLIRQKIEEIDPEGKIPPATVDELVVSLTKSSDMFVETPQYTDNLLERIANEPDWRKKAAMAAKLISQELG